jgi:Flp pilus assembly pilin Flp
MVRNTGALRDSRGERGVAALEYGLLVAAVAAVVIVIAVVLSRG